MIFKCRARVIGNVVIEQLYVARLEGHVEREFVGELCVEIQRGKLFFGEAWDFGVTLPGVHIHGRGVAGEIAVLKSEEGLGIGARFAGAFFALAAEVPFVIKLVDEFRVAFQDFVVHGGGAGHAAHAAGFGLTHA